MEDEETENVVIEISKKHRQWDKEAEYLWLQEFRSDNWVFWDLYDWLLLYGRLGWHDESNQDERADNLIPKTVRWVHKGYTS